MDYREILFYLQAVKAAHNQGDYSESDCEKLGYLYVQGRLHLEISKYENLFNQAAKNDLLRFGKWVKSNIEAPEAEICNDLKFTLNRQKDYAVDNRLNMDAATEIDVPFQLFLSNLIAETQVDIVGMSVEAKDLTGSEKVDANYSIGMAEIICQNLNHIFSDSSSYLQHETTTIEIFLVDSCRYLAEVKKIVALNS